jgi:hypothetical protein
MRAGSGNILVTGASGFIGIGHARIPAQVHLPPDTTPPKSGATLSTSQEAAR